MDMLTLSLVIMGVAIGALLLIWGGMSLYFHIRDKKKRRAALEREKARKAADSITDETEKTPEKTE